MTRGYDDTSNELADPMDVMDLFTHAEELESARQEDTLNYASIESPEYVVAEAEQVLVLTTGHNLNGVYWKPHYNRAAPVKRR